MHIYVTFADDGELSHREFIKVMKSRTTRGLEKVHMIHRRSSMV